MTTAIAISSQSKVDVTNDGVFENLPAELLSQNVFTHFTPHELAGKLSLVCKLWQGEAVQTSLFRLRQLRCSVIGESHWKKAIPESVFQRLKFGSPINVHYRMLKVSTFCRRLQENGFRIQGDAGLTLLSIPLGLSIPLLKETFPDKIRDEDLPGMTGFTSEPYEIIILNEVLEEVGEGTDRVLSSLRAADFEVSLSGFGWRAPYLYEAISLEVLSEQLFSKHPYAGKNLVCQERSRIFGEANAGFISGARLDLSEEHGCVEILYHPAPKSEKKDTSIPSRSWFSYFIPSFA